MRRSWNAKSRQQVEAIEGSHRDFATVHRAFEAAESVFWVVPSDMQASDVMAAYLDFTKPAAEAFNARGVTRAVGVSEFGRNWQTSAGLVSAALVMDDLIAGAGVSCRADQSLVHGEPINQAGAIKS